MRDGHLNKCIECTKADVLAHRLTNLERVRDYDRVRGSMPHRVAKRKEYRQTPEGRRAHARAMKSYLNAHPDRHRARTALRRAVLTGRVIPWPVCAVPDCDCKPQGHHPDYSRPLDVVWLCDAHHKQAHSIR